MGNLRVARHRLVARCGRLDQLRLDELGYGRVDTRSGELLFQIVTAREERATVALASNHLPFSEWGQLVTDDARLVDRMTDRAHIIETGTDSFQLRPTRTARTLRRP